MGFNCCFCAKNLSSKSSKKNHENTCLLGKDPICYLQMRRCVDIGEYKHTQCRFCNKDFKDRSNYIRHITSKVACRSKVDYGRGLMDGAASGGGTTVNNIDQSTTNNFYFLNYCKDTDYATLSNEDKKQIMYDLQDDLDLFDGEVKKYLTPIKHLCRVHSKPENSNIKCSNPRVNTVMVFNGEGFKKQTASRLLVDLIDKTIEPIQQVTEWDEVSAPARASGERLVHHLQGHTEAESNKLKYSRDNGEEFRRQLSVIERSDTDVPVNT